MNQVKNSAKFEAIGLDFLIRESDFSVQVIDLNSYPGYQIIKYPQMPHFLERYINDLFLEKKRDHFENFASDESFFGGKACTVKDKTLTLKLAFIHRQYKVQTLQNIISGQYILTAIDGHNQNKDDIVKGWFREGYLGRVVKLQKVNSGACSTGDSSNFAYILSEETLQKKTDIEVAFLSLAFEELTDFCDFVREGDVINF